MKKLKFTNLLFMFMVCTVFAQNKQGITSSSGSYATAGIPVAMITGPAGNQIPAQTSPVANPSLSCVVSGVTISVSGSLNFTNTSTSNFCSPQGTFVGTGSWTGNASTSPTVGFVTYTFSQPVMSVRVGYTQVNCNDNGTIITNSTSAVQLTDPCQVNVAGNVISGNYPVNSHGNVGITVSAATPFTTITLTNSGGQSGWGNANPCNFIIYPSPTITNCLKIALGDMCYKAGGTPHNTLFSVFNSATNGSFNNGCVAATINGVPCNSTNVTIEPLTPLPFGCTFNPNGTINIPLGTNPFDASIYYRFRSIANPAIFSATYEANFGISNRIRAAYYNISLSAANPVYNGTTNIFTSCKRQNNSSGFCIYDDAIASNVTFTETTTPINPYWMINTAGNVVLRPGIVIGNTVPVLPEVKYELTYNMCIPGSTIWCNTAKVVITYGYPLNKPVTDTNYLEKVVIAPNPSNDGIFIILFDTTIEKVTLEVYNTMGQKMYEAQADNTNEHLLVLDRLPKGTYILKLKDGNQTITKNIVKQ